MKQTITIVLTLIAHFSIAQQVKIVGTLSVSKEISQNRMQDPSYNGNAYSYYKVTLASEGKIYDVLKCNGSDVNFNNDQSKQYPPLSFCYLRTANITSLNGQIVKVEGQVINNYICSAKLFDTANVELPILDMVYIITDAETMQEFYTKELKAGTSFPLMPQQLNKTAKAIWNNFSSGQRTGYQDDECKSNAKLKPGSEYYYHILTGDEVDDLANLKCYIRVDSRRSNDTNDVVLKSVNKYYYKWDLIKILSVEDLQTLESVFSDIKKQLVDKFGQPINDIIRVRTKKEYSAYANFSKGGSLEIAIKYDKKMPRGEITYRGCK